MLVLLLLIAPDLPGRAAPPQDPSVSAAAPSMDKDRTLSPIKGERALAPRREDDRLAHIARYIAAIRSLKARFVQMNPDGSRHEGTFLFERPGRLRFAYDDGTPLLLVSDGRRLTFIDYDSGQVTRWPIRDTPLGLLASAKSADEILRSSAIRGVRPGPLPHLLWLDTADPEHPESGAASFLFASSDQGLTWLGWRIVEPRGAVTEVRLFDPTLNIEIAESAWRFKDPRVIGKRRRRRMR
ncbi:MAG: outer membrane lipoprotein carrier protein LolA [Alphaproteobacteria bacterium]|nr:MAG: outer membrane lipoprotein carrier protein LolA [Alphaproteobacteria bacterium]